MGILFARIGTSSHLRGQVLVAYRNALRGLSTVLASGTTLNRAWQADEVLLGLRAAIEASLRSVFDEAAAVGVREASVQLQAYGIDQGGRSTDQAHGSVADGLSAVMAQVDGQVRGAQALVATGAEPELVIGNNERRGVLNAGLVVSNSWFWIGAIAAGAWSWIIFNWGQQPGMTFHKQAVAALDERTTDCCLRVHGQVQPLDDPFHLTGQPRFAEYKDNPPFHWNCRTATALVRPQDADDDLTQQMIEAARQELGARQTGQRVEIHPASALSRRQRS